jgi:acetyl esterase/lipase
MDLTDAYENGAYIPDAASYPPRWAAEAEAFRAQLGKRARLDLPYGSDARQRFDLFLPEGEVAGLLIFIHGGYWLKFDKSQWSHFAAGAILRGWAVAMPSYRLAPEVRIADITQDVAAAVEAACAEVDGPVVVTGHSAGGHLAARMACLDLPASDRIKRYVPISPLSDLRPLMQTAMNAQLQIDAAEADAESPVFATPDADVMVWVGAEERPALLDQARWLSEAWGCGLRIAPGRHHFDVIEEMTLADSPLTGALLDGL